MEILRADGADGVPIIEQCVWDGRGPGHRGLRYGRPETAAHRKVSRQVIPGRRIEHDTRAHILRRLEASLFAVAAERVEAVEGALLQLARRVDVDVETVPERRQRVSKPPGFLRWRWRRRPRRRLRGGLRA